MSLLNGMQHDLRPFSYFDAWRYSEYFTNILRCSWFSGRCSWFSWGCSGFWGMLRVFLVGVPGFGGVPACSGVPVFGVPCSTVSGNTTCRRGTSFGNCSLLKKKKKTIQKKKKKKTLNNTLSTSFQHFFCIFNNVERPVQTSPIF